MEFLRVGQLVNTHGIRGEVKIKVNTDFPEQRFALGKKMWLTHSTLPEAIPLTITHVRTHKSSFLVRFQEWNNINQAEPFKGGWFVVSLDDEAVDEDDGFYIHQIIGCHVVTTDGEQVGIVKDILTLPANDVWVVERDGAKELLLPYITDIVKEVDVSKHQITIEWMEGLE
jgi:16S rRNA processing protein RimM